MTTKTTRGRVKVGDGAPKLSAAHDDEIAGDEPATNDDTSKPTSRRRIGSRGDRDACLPVHPDDRAIFEDAPIDPEIVEDGECVFQGWSKDSRVAHRRVRVHLSEYAGVARLWVRGWYLSVDARWRPSRVGFYLGARDAVPMLRVLRRACSRIERNDVRRFGRAVGQHRLEAGGGAMAWTAPGAGGACVTFRVPYADIAALTSAVQSYVDRLPRRRARSAKEVDARQLGALPRLSVIEVKAVDCVAACAEKPASLQASSAPNALAPEDRTSARVGFTNYDLGVSLQEYTESSIDDSARAGRSPVVGFDLSATAEARAKLSRTARRRTSGAEPDLFEPTLPPSKPRRESEAQAFVRRFYRALADAGISGPERIEWARDVRLARGLVAGFRRALLDPADAIEAFLAAAVENGWLRTRERPDFKLAVRISESIAREMETGGNMNAPEARARRALIGLVRRYVERPELELRLRQTIRAEIARGEIARSDGSLRFLLSVLGQAPVEVDEIAQEIRAAFRHEPGADQLTPGERYVLRSEAQYQGVCAAWRRAYGVVGAPVPPTFADLDPRRYGGSPGAVREKLAALAGTR